MGAGTRREPCLVVVAAMVIAMVFFVCAVFVVFIVAAIFAAAVFCFLVFVVLIVLIVFHKNTPLSNIEKMEKQTPLQVLDSIAKKQALIRAHPQRANANPRSLVLLCKEDTLSTLR